jgi:hypothetical protein
MSKEEIFEKTLTINDFNEKEIIINMTNVLLNFMFEHSPFPEYFMLRLKDSEKNPFSKDLSLKWAVSNKSDYTEKN